jgi:porphobilinogen synthase
VRRVRRQVIRPRRLRRTAAIRGLVRETRLAAEQLIYPVFVAAGASRPVEIEAMPGQYRWPTEGLCEEAARAYESGVKSVLIFGIPESKDELGSAAYDAKGVVQEAVRALKRTLPDMVVMTDVCLCQYTSHGHCGVVDEMGQVLNDPTLGLLARTAVSHAEAGADVVAPSDMMDGTVAAIREALDDAGFDNALVMSYAAKYASAFYGPFREAAESAPAFGDRKSYQMDPANQREALKEVALDIEQGADIVMVKPALAYLDVIQLVRQQFRVPVAAYNVSGEYAMVKGAALRGWLDEKAVVLEILTAIRRAGADMILTYFAKEAAGWLSESS